MTQNVDAFGRDQLQARQLELKKIAFKPNSMKVFSLFLLSTAHYLASLCSSAAPFSFSSWGRAIKPPCMLRRMIQRIAPQIIMWHYPLHDIEPPLQNEKAQDRGT